MEFSFIAGRSAARVQPSQSPAVTAPPKGEPRHASTAPALERSCLSPRERWQRREPLTERGESTVASSQRPVPLTPFPKEGGHGVEGTAHLRGARETETVIKSRGMSRGRPLHSSSERFMRVGGDALHRPALYHLHPHWNPCLSPRERGIDGEGDVGGGVPDTPPYTNYARIGAFLPLPSGEVAAA